jgi:hypothetical protein
MCHMREHVASELQAGQVRRVRDVFEYKSWANRRDLEHGTVFMDGCNRCDRRNVPVSKDGLQMGKPLGVQKVFHLTSMLMTLYGYLSL